MKTVKSKPDIVKKMREIRDQLSLERFGLVGSHCLGTIQPHQANTPVPLNLYIRQFGHIHLLILLLIILDYILDCPPSI